MSKIDTFTKSGAKSETAATLNKVIFDLVPNHDLLDLAYRSYLAAGRSAHAKTLTRGEVRGGGRKPWRQKGTGKARAGSIRLPHWKGGGVAFGPTGNENYAIKVPLAMKRLAIRQALSAQAKDGKVAVIEAFELKDAKTKSATELMAKLGLAGNILLVTDQLSPEIDRATRNLAGVELVQAKYLNVFIILNADHIIIAKPALTVIDQWLGEK